LAPVVLAILVGAPLYAIATALPPYWLQHMRPVTAELSTRLRADDLIYLYYGAGQAFQYYAARAGIRPDQIVTGRCAAGQPRLYLQDLDRLRGRSRVWLVASHSRREGGEEALMVAYLDRIGRRLETFSQGGSSGHSIEAANAYLFDLSDPAALARSSWETQPIPAGPVLDPPLPWDCYGVGLSQVKRSR
jgi:hypothetical protein